MKISIFSVLICLLFSAASWADFDSAMSNYERKDYYAAANEFKKLSAENDSDAQYMLGYLYATGKGVLKDYVEAHKWFNLAASHGNNDAIKARAGVEKHMSGEQISLAQKQARNWTPGRHRTPALAMDELEPVTVPVLEKELRDKESIRQVQRKLAQLGYRPGPADGAMGNKTRQAIRQYQRDKKLPINSKVTRSLLDSLYPDGLQQGAVQVRSEQQGGLLFPEIWEQTGKHSGGAKNNEQLREDLTALLEKGRQRRAAQSWFLNDLSKLINQNQTDWSVILLNDDFQDGNFTASPKWSVLSGHFEVKNKGLYSQVITQASQPDKPSQEKQDFSTAILGAILEHATRKDKKNKTVNKTDEIAKIVTHQVIPASFALKAKLTIQSKKGQVEFGPYAGNTQQQAYQLLILPEQDQIELLRINSRGSSVIDSKRKTVSLNQAHVFEWLRDESGMMTLAMDGEQLFHISDRRYMNDFSGFMLKNLSGSMILHEVTIVGKE